MTGPEFPTTAARHSLMPGRHRARPDAASTSTPRFAAWRFAMLWLISFAGPANAAADVSAWGNFRGMRIDGTLMRFETELAVVEPGWSGISRTAKGRQQSAFSREDGNHVVATQLGGVAFRQAVSDVGPSTVRLDLTARVTSDSPIEGAYLVVKVQAPEFSEGSFDLGNGDGQAADFQAGPGGRHAAGVSRARIAGSRFQLDVEFEHPTIAVLRQQGAGFQLFLRLREAEAGDRKTAAMSFTISVAGEPDKKDISLTVDARREGRRFSGLGGNFRLQSDADQFVIRYLLENLPVAWARAELPLAYWQPDEHSRPTEAPPTGMHPRVRAAMELARHLRVRTRVLILSIWSAPRWAIVGEPRRGPKIGGVYGNFWKPEKSLQLYESITSYLLYLKKEFGIEVDAISFNEPDIGVNVHLPAADHAVIVRELGAYLAANGLRTQLLLGDTSDAAAWGYVEPALADEAARPFAGALSFHSWQGIEAGNLARWRDAAIAADLPLVVAEAGIDSNAWQYPDVFLEPSYAGDEIAAYLRILSHAQPDSLMQWQLTADYPLVRQIHGPGTEGPDPSLEPTQRFWNLKQLSDTSAGLRVLYVEGGGSDIAVAALGDGQLGRYAIHAVNSGATRTLHLAGLPASVQALQVYVTDSRRGMSSETTVAVHEGRAEIVLEGQAYTTLASVD